MDFIIKIGDGEAHFADSKALEILLSQMLAGATAEVFFVNNLLAVGDRKEYVTFNGVSFHKALPKPN